jgi:hypothetical protein
MAFALTITSTLIVMAPRADLPVLDDFKRSLLVSIFHSLGLKNKPKMLQLRMNSMDSRLSTPFSHKQLSVLTCATPCW